MSRSRSAAPWAGIVLPVLIAGAVGACGEPPPPTDGQVEGALLGKALVAHLPQSLQWTAPYRCARLATTVEDPAVDGVSWNAADTSISIEPKGKAPRLAAIADARASATTNTEALTRLRDTLNEQEVDVLVSLGGMGLDAAAIENVLGAITDKANYIVVALPGDRESVPAHRTAITHLANGGARIIDGSRYRRAHLGPLQLATMPGISKAANLIAEDEGCVHTEVDAQALAKRLATTENPTVLLSYAPWRQIGASATDLGIGAIHTGELALAPLQLSGEVVASVHGMVVQTTTADSGSLRLGPPAASISANSLNLAPGPIAGPEAQPSALMLTVSSTKLAWKRLPVHQEE